MKNFMTIVAMVFLLLCGFLSLHAQTGEWVRDVHGAVLVAPSMTIKEARDEAMKQAQGEAIRRIVGVQVQSEQARWQSEHMVGEDTKYFDLFSEIHRTTSFGRILDQRIVAEGLEAVTTAGIEGQKKYVVSMDVQVMKESNRSDPEFTLQMSLNKEIFSSSPVISESDEVLATILPSKDCFLTLLSVSSDTVRVVFPNEFSKQNRIAAGCKFEFPPAELREAGVRLRVQLPSSQKHATEMLVAIATKQSMAFVTGQREGLFHTIPTYVGAYNELTRWLVQIPPEERTEVSAIFEIIGK
jgi:hypothetical protein